MNHDKNHDVNIYFDESGKSNETIHLMGGILIPKSYYEVNKEKLDSIVNESSIHWTSYGGHTTIRDSIKVLISEVLLHHHLVKMNVISFDINKIEANSKPIKPIISDVVDRTIYTKFPERVVYGLIRKYGKNTFINADVFIEHDYTYEAKNYDLKVDMLRQLNIQSIYRGENFRINKVAYLSKRSSYGIEVTDLLLGIVRTIILNESSDSKRKKAKNLLIMELLTDNKSNLFQFLKSIRLFEWHDDTNELKLTPFESYLDVFFSSNLEFLG
ncbi:MAG: DUF3800 domain-containing protein [Kurthia sp.]|nr:DUF3800 domain-containing protein [Candidatus Kurthia equi]